MKLNAAREVYARIEKAKAKLDALKSAAAAAKVSLLDGLPHAKTQSSPTEKFVVAIAEEERKLGALADEFGDVAIELCQLINQRVTGSAGGVLVLRYVSCLPWSVIQTRLGYSESQVFYLHREGRKIFNSGGKRN